ncbi:MAG: heavy-metal-associated domain-containing protein [Prevotellaceae bacterium]|jgi:copper ion binding protein|nr:heavy-metal-associated domain-containing protein [Prevotellaceae bacterium]
MNTKKLSIFILLLAFAGISTANAGDKTVKFRTENMRCGGCAGKIKKAVTALDGVSEVSANLELRVVTIAYDDQKVNSDQLKTAIVEAKFTAEDYDPNEVIARTISFKANQIGCGGCVAKVKKNIGAETGVISVDVDLPTKEVKVEYDANKLSAKEIKKDFQKFDYTVVRYWANEKVKYASFNLEQLDESKVADVEGKLTKEKGVLDVTVNGKTKTVAIAYNGETFTEEALENIKKVQ